jgi:hypothetical protein
MNALVVAIWAGQVFLGQVEALSWIKVVEQAPWKARDSAGELVFDGKMWLLGGWFSSHAPCPNDVWNSADGIHWTEVTSRAPWIHGDLATSLVHQNKMWIMGGWAGGRLPGASASNQVWCCTDGADWRIAAAKAPWWARLGAGSVVFQGKMWILGGVKRYYDGDELLADVWSSPDGRQWTQVTDRSPWAARIWFSSLVYKERMWVLGGWSNKPSKNWNDVWYSSDGKDWKELVTERVWSPRHEQSAYVFGGKIWIAGGNPWPLANDVWQIEIPDHWFKH